jgi:hypothetical protein
MTPEEEKQFDEKFAGVINGVAIRTNTLSLKDFYTSLLNSRLQSIKEEVEKKRQEVDFDGWPDRQTYAYNQALDDVLTILNKQEDETFTSPTK